MELSRDRILTTHTGSLPRPRALIDLYARRSRGEAVDDAVLAAAGARAMRDVISRQDACGIDVGNNGEQERESFFLYMRHRMTGFGGEWHRTPSADVERYPAYKEMAARLAAARGGVSHDVLPKVIGPVEYRDPNRADDEPRRFRQALDEAKPRFVETFLTAPSPGIIASAVKNEHYDTMEAYVAALAKALRHEYEAIHRAGFLLQLDCPDLALERHRTYQDRDDQEFVRFVELIVGAMNDAIADIPRERIRLHVCWGNYAGPHDCDVPFSTIWPALCEARVGAFVLPFANGRHAHEYHVFEEAPLGSDQALVAGVIDTLTNVIEHPEVVAERLERVARAIGDPHRLLAGTDCGFDTSAGMGQVASDIVWAKLASLSQGAAIASKRLFG